MPFMLQRTNGSQHVCTALNGLPTADQYHAGTEELASTVLWGHPASLKFVPLALILGKL